MKRHLEYPDRSVYDHLKKYANEYSAICAIEYYGRTISYRELLREVNRCACALAAAGVFSKKALAIARIYYGTCEDSKESLTLAKYMGEYKKTFYGDWIVEYVTKSNNVSQTSTIEK